MKNFKKLFLPTLLAALTSVSAFAQQDAASLVNEMNSQVRAMASPVYSLIMTVIVLLGMVSLVMVAVKMNSADQQASNRALAWFGILVFCLVAAVVMKNLI